MRLIVIHGAAADGKLTVANEIAERTRFKVFHNHLTIDSIPSDANYLGRRHRVQDSNGFLFIKRIVFCYSAFLDLFPRPLSYDLYIGKRTHKYSPVFDMRM